MSSLEKLEALAKAATPGPWRLDTEVHPKGLNDPKQVRFFDELHQAWSHLVYCHWSPEDAAYIAAANPQAILSLLAEHRQLIERVEVLEGERGWCDDMSLAPRGGPAANEEFLAYWPEHQTADGCSYAAHMEVTWVNKKGLFTTNAAVMDGYFPEDWQPTHWRPITPPNGGE